jgi:hypothetical protein
VEYGFKSAKNHLIWTDFRVSKFHQLERWWKIVSSTYLMVSLPFHGLNPLPDSDDTSTSDEL